MAVAGFGDVLLIILLMLFVMVMLAIVFFFTRSKKIKVKEIEIKRYDRQRYERVRWIFNEQYPVDDCPVMFLRGAVLKDMATDKDVLQLKFTNMGKKAIRSVYIAIDFMNDAGDMAADGSTIQIGYLDMNCGGGDYFGSKQLITLGGIEVFHIIITYRKVVFTDGTVWETDTGKQAVKTAGITLLKNSLPVALQDKVSEIIFCKPEILDDRLWRCACGCLAGGKGGNFCPNCHRTFAQAQEAASIGAPVSR